MLQFSIRNAQLTINSFPEIKRSISRFGTILCRSLIEESKSESQNLHVYAVDPQNKSTILFNVTHGQQIGTSEPISGARMQILECIRPMVHGSREARACRDVRDVLFVNT